jgi:hypothetical protein
VSYIRISENPKDELCPYHRLSFEKKQGKFYWKCPAYHQCGFHIGSRRRIGYVTRMWLQQTAAGKKWMDETVLREYEESWPRSG